MRKVEKQTEFLAQVDKNLNSIYCYHDIPGQSFFEQHSHYKGQLIYVEGGTINVETEDKIYFVPANHYIWIPLGMKHSTYSSSDNVMMRTLYFPMDQEELPFYNEIGTYPVHDLLLQLLLYTKDWRGNIERFNRKLYPIVQAIKVLLPDFSQNEVHLTLPKIRDEKLKEVTHYLSENIEKNIMLSDIAEKFDINERSLHRLFKKDINLSFIKFFTLVRMYKAIDYLAQRNYSISEIASKVGYSSIPTFSNTFYKVIGKRPSDYQRGTEILK